MKTKFLKNWILVNETTKERMRAEVPGDITRDLFHAGKIEEPFFGMNHKKIEPILRTDFTYVNEFELNAEMASSEAVALRFKGIDLLSEIYLNDQCIGNTENMFLEYVFDVKPYLKSGKNILAVKLKSTLNYMDQIDCKDYFAVFNVPRIFLRKAQCHFGWDWAPNIPGYGIWKDVVLEYGDRFAIDDVHYIAQNNGNIIFNIVLNYNIRPQVDAFGKELKNSAAFIDGDTLQVFVSQKPNCSQKDKEKIVAVQVTGQKNIVNVKIDSPELWWPSGYGAQPLYNYRVELIRGGKVISEKKGRIGFREISLLEEPLDATSIGFRLRLNGKDIFAKGSNWVPIECFTGTLKSEKYENLIKKAKNANINMLRVWGGGIYENDCFYELCDELGIMVWQDFMFACADIPDQDVDWLNNAVKECEFQVKRLRNHASIVYWCGGNEKTGSYGLMVSHGDFFTNNVLQGLVRNLDKTRPFARQSPYSYTDVGNDKSTGESHSSSFEISIVKGIRNYRKTLSENRVSFISECALMGPCSRESFEKMFAKSDLWPMNAIWQDRLMDNPYAGILMPFADRQKKFAEELYGELKGLDDFIAKGMLVHAECLRAEIEYARLRKEYCGGILNWMYSDIWPTASWSIVDYYGEPKHAYYTAKKSFEPILLTFVRNENGELQLIGVNDTLSPVQVKIHYGAKGFDGKVFWEESMTFALPSDSIYTKRVDERWTTEADYLFIEAEVDGKPYKNVYSDAMWSTSAFHPKYAYSVHKISDTQMRMVFNGENFAKSIVVSFPDNYKYEYSDNYFDLEAGEVKEITVTSTEDIDITKMAVTDFSVQTGN